MTSKKEQQSEEDALIKRNNQAPGFPASLVRSRLQLLIERFIQNENLDLQEYIKAQRILKVDISITTLKEWYPGPNWKKDIDKAIRYFMKIEGKADANGNFDYFSLFSRAKLDNSGLHLNVDPEVLELYIIRAGNFNTELDYNVTKLFKCAYTHEMYWEMLKHDYPKFDYRFFLTPEEINNKFKTKYQNSNITTQIIEPSEREIRAIYDAGLSPRYITVTERRDVIGRCKKIVGWEFSIHNEERTKRQDLAAREAYIKIDRFLRSYLEHYRINILGQVSTFKSEKIIQLWMRLEKYEKTDTTQIKSQEAYLCFILQRYGINPRSKKIDKKAIPTAPLFEKQEKDLATGVTYWMQCLNHIQESPVNANIKELFGKLKFYNYTEDEDENTIVFATSQDVVNIIETYYIEDFKPILTKYFPGNLQIMYHVSL